MLEGRRYECGGLLAASCLVLFALSASQPSRADTSDRLHACVSEEADWVSVNGPDADGIFQSGSGERFYPVDVTGPMGDRSEIADQFYKGSEFDAFATGPKNRWGLRPAWIRTGGDEDQRLFQALALAAGQVIFAPQVSQGSCADALRQLEQSARTAGHGIWQDQTSQLVYATSAPSALEQAAGRYVIARGRIVSLGKTRSTRYLNFGRYWKEDFTVTMKAAGAETLQSALARSGWQIEDLAGQTVEVRGVVQNRDGPHIELLHPGQLIVLDRKRAGRDGHKRK